MTTPVTNNTSTNTSQSSQAASRLSTNYEDFLKLLMVQLKHQDPTSPTDTDQLTQQIASLSQVEQQINTNQNLEKLISMFGIGQMNNAVGYIGKQVDAEGNKGILLGNQAVFVYNVEGNAATAEVTIKDAMGNTVFKGNGTTIAGRNQVLWDGKNSFTGQAMPSGTYTISVDAKDATGKTVKTTTMTTGQVTSVDMKDGMITLSLGDIELSLDKIQSIREAGL